MNECPIVFHWANLQNQGLQTLLRSSLKDPVEHCFWKSHGLFSSGPLILSYRGMLTAAFTVGIFGANMQSFSSVRHAGFNDCATISMVAWSRSHLHKAYLSRLPHTPRGRSTYLMKSRHTWHRAQKSKLQVWHTIRDMVQVSV